MSQPQGSPAPDFRFGPFEVDVRAGELRKSGIRIRLPGQPFEILSLLLDKAGEVVTREEIRRRLWPENTFVDYEHSLNAAVNKLREALADSAERPLYIETIPRRGYRFIGPVERARAAAAPSPAAITAPPAGARPAGGFPLRWRVTAALALFAVVAAGSLETIRRTRAGRNGPPTVRSLAVLPFENLSRDPEQEYFAEGITGALISRLAQIRSIRVVSRTSVMPFRGARRPLPEIARALSADAIVEGTIQRSGDRVSIFANLVDASTDRSFWSGQYDGDVTDVLALQSRVADAIAGGIRARTTSLERPSWKRTVDPDAYAAYLKGRFYLSKGLAWSNQRAIEQFRESIRRDPSFAPAWAWLAEAELFGFPPKQSMPAALADVRRALDLDPSLSDALSIHGLAQTFWSWDWAGAEKSFRSAISVDPGSPEVHYRFSHLLVALGRFGEAEAECRRALELSPLSTDIGQYLGRILYFARRDSAAIEQFRRTLELDRNDYWSNLFVSVVYAHRGQMEEAQSHLERAATLSGQPASRIAEIQRAYRTGGRPAVLRALMPDSPPREGPVGSSGEALTAAQLGNRELAIQWLQRAFESHTRDLIYMNVDPSYDSIRDDPRFVEIVRKVGLPPVARAASGG